jgi:hypothetical protein
MWAKTALSNLQMQDSNQSWKHGINDGMITGILAGAMYLSGGSPSVFWSRSSFPPTMIDSFATAKWYLSSRLGLICLKAGGGPWVSRGYHRSSSPDRRCPICAHFAGLGELLDPSAWDVFCILSSGGVRCVGSCCASASPPPNSRR